MTNVEWVNHPKHYQSCSHKTRNIVELLGVPSEWHDRECIVAIESIDYIRQDFHIATALTYLWRYDQKNREDRIRDLEKAYWYIERHSVFNPLHYNRDTIALGMIRSLLEEARANGKG